MAEEQAEQVEEAAKGGKKGLIIMVVVVLLAVGASVGGTLYFVGQDGADASAEVVEAPPTSQPAIYHEMRPAFVVNYNTATKPRYLQAEVSVMARQPELIEALIDHTPLVRSKVLEELSNASFEEIRTHEGKQALRDTLRTALDELISQETEFSGIESVLFTNFVLQ